MRRRFKDPSMQKAYEWFTTNDPAPNTRGKGGMHSAFHRGRYYDFKSTYLPTSLAHAAWRAGRDLRTKTQAKRDPKP